MDNDHHIWIAFSGPVGCFMFTLKKLRQFTELAYNGSPETWGKMYDMIPKHAASSCTHRLEKALTDGMGDSWKIRNFSPITFYLLMNDRLVLRYMNGTVERCCISMISEKDALDHLKDEPSKIT